MSTEFGYIGGNAPTQSGQNNSGLINPKDMYNLVTTDKLKFDSMYRHILTEEISGSPSTLDYTDERLTKYPNLIVIGNNIQMTGNQYLKCRFSADGGSSFHSSGYSRYAYYGGNNNTLTNDRNSSTDSIHLTITGNTSDEPWNIYLQISGLNNEFETRVAFYQVHNYLTNMRIGWGGGNYNTHERHNAFQIVPTGDAFASGKVSIYGLEAGF
jgi:hypothetical protein|tara:strand:+ start:1619 stop:2254 length:636 start_codon:yes stop_codon:yes gene_type:complete